MNRCLTPPSISSVPVVVQSILDVCSSLAFRNSANQAAMEASGMIDTCLLLLEGLLDSAILSSSDSNEVSAHYAAQAGFVAQNDSTKTAVRST